MKVVRVVAAVGCAVALQGCALWPASQDDRTDRPAAALNPVVQMYWLTVDAPEPARALLLQHLDVVRFQFQPAKDALSRAEIERLAGGAPAQARALLDTLGYFDSTVRLIRPVDASLPLPLYTLKVELGEVAKVGHVDLQVQGPWAQDDPGVWRPQWLAQFPLRVGDVFTQDAWSQAKIAALGQAQRQGYPQAKWARTSAVVAAYEQPIRITASLLLDSGPLSRYGALDVRGLEHYPLSSITHLQNFQTGQPYDEQTLVDFNERLRKVGLFERVSVGLAPDPQDPAAHPVRVRVTELPRQQTTLSLGYADGSGPRVSVEWLHRLFLGRPWIYRTHVEWGRTRRHWDQTWNSHPKTGGVQDLVSTSFQHTQEGGLDVSSKHLRVGRSLDTESRDRLVFAEWRQSSSSPLNTRTGGALVLAEPRKSALSLNAHTVWSALDHPVLPTDGHTTHLQVAGGYAWGGTGQRSPFARLFGRWTLYQPVGTRWWSTVRLEAGQVVAQNALNLPDTLLFRTGGDDSIRGYAPASIGPRLPNGVTGFGRHVLTGSVEMARPLRADWPSVWGAVFVDAGDAPARWSDYSTRWGYGLGVRWRSPIGPLKVDLARAHREGLWRLHFSLGIAL